VPVIPVVLVNGVKVFMLSVVIAGLTLCVKMEGITMVIGSGAGEDAVVGVKVKVVL